MNWSSLWTVTESLSRHTWVMKRSRHKRLKSSAIYNVVALGCLWGCHGLLKNFSVADDKTGSYKFIDAWMLRLRLKIAWIVQFTMHIIMCHPHRHYNWQQFQLTWSGLSCRAHLSLMILSAGSWLAVTGSLNVVLWFYASLEFLCPSRANATNAAIHCRSSSTLSLKIIRKWKNNNYTFKVTKMYECTFLSLLVYLISILLLLYNRKYLWKIDTFKWFDEQFCNNTSLEFF